MQQRIKPYFLFFLLSLFAITGYGQGTPPSWVGGLRYSYNSGNNLLTFEGQAGIGKLMFERTDGTAINTTNPDGVTVTNGVFYDPGLGPDAPSGTWNKKWELYYTSGPELRITAQQSATTATYSYTLTPSLGAYHVSMPVAVTVTPPPSTTISEPLSNTALLALIDQNLSVVGNERITAAKLRAIFVAMAATYVSRAEYREVLTFQAMLNLLPVRTLTLVKVAIDTDKGLNNTTYQLWPSGKRKWLASIDDN